MFTFFSECKAAATMNMPSRTNGHTADSSSYYSAIKQEYNILSEYKMIQSENIEGVYVIPSFKSAFLWYGVIFVRQGLYSGGIFRFSISLPDQFPNDTEVPTVIFETVVPHPLICPYTQRLDISEALTVWTEGESHLWQLLKFIQFAFEQARACARGKVSNAAAADQLLHQSDDFRGEVREAVRLARDAVYDPPKSEDKHYITFERFEADVHGATLESIRTRQDASLSPNASGVSWLM